MIKTPGHYQTTRPLGKGSMVEVHQAKNQRLRRDVAIKVLPEEFAGDADRVVRFLRDAKWLASPNHTNIAATCGLEESCGTNFPVLELVEGEAGIYASAAAGPRGRSASAETDVVLEAEILSYSRSLRLLESVSPERSALRLVGGTSKNLYRKELSAMQIMVEGIVSAPEGAQLLISLLNEKSL
jgi:serine/threonine protein kinase